MSKYPSVRLENGLSNLQLIQKKLDICKPGTWSGDLEVRLLAIGLQRDVVVVTTATNGSLPLLVSILPSHHQFLR